MDQALSDILKIADEIERIFEASLPHSNPGTVNRIKGLCIQMKGVDSYINEKSSKISRLTEDYFSPRKHEKHHGGANGLRTTVTFDLLNRIRSRVAFLDQGTPH